MPVDDLREQALTERVLLLSVREVGRLLVNDVLEREAHLCILLVLRLALQEKLVERLEVLCLLQVQLVCGAGEMVGARTAKVKLLQGSAECFLDLAELLRGAADVVLLLERVTDLQVVHVLDVEIAVDFTVLAFGHDAGKLHELALVDPIFEFLELLRQANSDDQRLTIELRIKTKELPEQVARVRLQVHVASEVIIPLLQL